MPYSMHWKNLLFLICAKFLFIKINPDNFHDVKFWFWLYQILPWPLCTLTRAVTLQTYQWKQSVIWKNYLSVFFDTVMEFVNQHQPVCHDLIFGSFTFSNFATVPVNNARVLKFYFIVAVLKNELWSFYYLLSSKCHYTFNILLSDNTFLIHCFPVSLTSPWHESQ